MKPGTPKLTPEQRALEAAQIERMRELRVENARETNKVFEARAAFRKRLRGFQALLSNGFGGSNPT